MKASCDFPAVSTTVRLPAQGDSRAEHRLGMQEKRLLICDDEPAFGRFVQNVAEDLGYDVRVTTEGRAFIEAYNSFKSTMIILYKVMPGMDGIELVV